MKKLIKDEVHFFYRGMKFYSTVIIIINYLSLDHAQEKNGLAFFALIFRPRLHFGNENIFLPAVIKQIPTTEKLTAKQL